MNFDSLIADLDGVWAGDWESFVAVDSFCGGGGIADAGVSQESGGYRYGLWIAASVKFLVPFSVLIKLGSYFSSLRSAHEGAANSVVSLTIMQLNQPFDAPAVAPPVATTASALQLLSRFAPVLFVVWLVGMLAVLAVWLVRWYRITAIAKRATPLREGAEAEIVARLQDGQAWERRVEIVSTADAIEPGIFGIARPVLLWPAAMCGQVSEAHIESIVEHELCHVRRRDNLTAMVHMLVEALFWFHPFVWWIGGRLVEDRERACDEAVVESGRERRVYAESILKVCEFCVESPLPCVPGVSGADLKRRIAMIMSHRAVRPIGVGRKLLLVAACCWRFRRRWCRGRCGDRRVRRSGRAWSCRRGRLSLVK